MPHVCASNTSGYPRSCRPTGGARSTARHSPDTAPERAYPGPPTAYQGLSRPAGAELRPTSAPPTRAGIPWATAPQEGPGAPPGTRRAPLRGRNTPYIGMDYRTLQGLGKPSGSRTAPPAPTVGKNSRMEGGPRSYPQGRKFFLGRGTSGRRPARIRTRPRVRPSLPVVCP